MTEQQKQVHAEQVRQLYRTAPVGMAATLVSSAVLSYVLWSVVPHRTTIIWFGCLSLITLLRAVHLYGYHRRSISVEEAGKWGAWFVAGLALTGTAWGASGIFLFPASSIVHQVFLAFVLGGMVAGAAGTFSIQLRAFLAFSVPAVVPLGIRFLALGDPIHITMGWMALFFGAMFTSVAVRVRTMTATSLRLRFENNSLVSYLAHAKEKAEKLNDELRSEIAERTKAEEELMQHREHLGELVQERTLELSSTNARLQREIRAREEAEASLRQSEEYFRSLIENTLDIITVLDSSGKILFESPSVEKLMGYRPEEMTGINVFEFVHPDDRLRAQEALIRVLQSPGTSESIEVRFRHRHGSWNVIEAVGKSIVSDSNDVRIIINSRDMTERKRQESNMLRSQKLESLGVLAGGIAHDFNNLMTGITANIELAKMHTQRGQELYDILKKSEQAAARARDLTQQLLTFSMGGEPIKKVFLLNDLLKESAGFALRGSRAVCSFTIPDDLRPVEADEGLLRQVIHNIVINADQSMPLGGMINIACENVNLGAQEVRTLVSGDYVKIAFADHGIGIPKEHLSKIFDPYFTTKHNGSGLGLATSYSIVKKHGGEIAVESAIGEGTTVVVLLPASRKEFTAAGAGIGALVFGHGRILIMDDEAIVRDTAGRILQTAGYEVELAADGNDMLALYRKACESGNPFAAVILDLTVPGGMGGKDALKMLLSIDPAVKAIVSSGYSQDPIMAHYRDYGFMGVLAKPYKIRDLSEIVNKVITAAPAAEKNGRQ